MWVENTFCAHYMTYKWTQREKIEDSTVFAHRKILTVWIWAILLCKHQNNTRKHRAVAKSKIYFKKKQKILKGKGGSRLWNSEGMGWGMHFGISKGKRALKHGSHPWLCMDIFWNCPFQLISTHSMKHKRNPRQLTCHLWPLQVWEKTPEMGQLPAGTNPIWLLTLLFHMQPWKGFEAVRETHFKFLLRHRVSCTYLQS